MLSEAEKIALAFGDDGSNLTADIHGTGEEISLERACLDNHAEAHGRGAGNGLSVFEFWDGSAIVLVGNRWDVRHVDCVCGHCWAGVGSIPACLEN